VTAKGAAIRRISLEPRPATALALIEGQAPQPAHHG